MSYRALINRKIAKTRYLVYIGGCIFGVSIALLFSGFPEDPCFAIGMAGMFLVAIHFIRQEKIRCPGCGTPFGQAVIYGSRIRPVKRLSLKFKYCPGCGFSLDRPVGS